MKQKHVQILLLAVMVLLLSSCGSTGTLPTVPSPTNPNNGRPDRSSLLGTWLGTNTAANFSSSLTLSKLTNCQEPVPSQVYCDVSGSLSFTFPGKSECAISYSFDDGILAGSTTTVTATLVVSKNTEAFSSSFGMSFSDTYTVGGATATNLYYTLEACNATSASSSYTVTKQ